MAITEKDPSLQKQGLVQQYGGSHSGSWVDRLPPSWIPYVQLARLSPPIGLATIYFPHFFGIMLGGIILDSPLTSVIYTSLLLLAASFFWSNAIHGWNDLIDAPVDARIERTRTRPIPRGAISPRGAFIFTLSQCIGSGVFLFFLPEKTAFYTIPTILANIYYLFGKRHTNLVQLVLGNCLGYGVIIGVVSMGLDPLNDASLVPATTLFLSSVLYTTIYDTIYSHQDLKDDTKIGVKSMAVLCRDQTKIVLWVLVAILVTLLGVCGYTADLGLIYNVVTVGGCVVSMTAIISSVDLKVSADCWWGFRYVIGVAGACMGGGLVAAYAFS